MIEVLAAMIEILGINENAYALFFMFYDCHVKGAMWGKLRGLFLEIEFLEDSRVAARIILLEIDKMSLAVRYHAEKAAAGMVILLVLLQMVGEFGNALAQKCDLDFRRAGILIVYVRLLDNAGLLSCG